MTAGTWTPCELARRDAVQAGTTVVANVRKGADEALVAWAEAEGLAVYIGRWSRRRPNSKWSNPFKVPIERVRDAACDRYEEHFELQAAIPELRGKVLICWCHPKRCHGDFLARLANEAGPA